MDRIYLAQHLFEQRHFDESIAICSEILSANALDQAAWFLKLRALTEKDFIDDTELEEEGVGEILLDQNALAANGARPGTSLQRPLSTSQGGLRPMSSQNRPNTGFARPGTGTQHLGGINGDVKQAFQGGRPGTSRPLTVAGRLIRLGTQSMMMAGESGNFIESAQIDVQKISKRPALELTCECMRGGDSNDWWWLARTAKAYYQLGMLREAQQHFRMSLKSQEMINTFLELGKIFLRIDQPNSAQNMYQQGLESNPGETLLLLGIARVHQALNEFDKATETFKKVLHWDASNVESIASIAGQHFYSDHPEIALRFYRRLLQMGVSNAELWNNVGLCCFYSSQYDMTLGCFERALALADDNNMADVWYNIGHVAIGIGDMPLATQAFKICVSIDANHAEAFNNLGVLELRKGSRQQACSYFEMATELADHHFEPMFNAALVAETVGDMQKSWKMVEKALSAFPGHADSKELRDRLVQEFVMV